MNTHDKLPLPGVFSEVIAIQGFRSLWVGQIFSQLAINSLLFVLALRIYQITGSNAAVSGLFLVYGIPAVLFGMAAGTIVDKLDKRLILFTCDIVRSMLIASFILFSKNIYAIYMLTLLNAIITQFYVPAEAPSIPRMVSSTQLVTANSLFSFTYFSSLAVGSIFAGPFLRVFGPNGVFAFISVLFLFAAWNVWYVPSQIEKNLSVTRVSSMSLLYILRRIWANIAEGISYIRESRVLTESLLLLAGTQVIIALLGTLGPGFADRVLQIDIRDASLIITGPVVLGIILGALWVGFEGNKLSSNSLIHQGIIGAGSILMLISLVAPLKSMGLFTGFLQNEILLPIILVLFFSLGVANSFLDVPANSILQRESQGKMRGRVYGLLTAAVGGVGILPVVLGGVLADVVGSGKVLFLLGVCIAGYGVYRIRYNKNIA